MKKKLSVTDLDVRGKRVFVRVDFNVPLTKEGTVADATRIEAALPTIRYLEEHGARIILASHLGRPKGKRAPELSLRPVADDLSKRLGKPVTFVPEIIGPEATATTAALKDGEVALLENVRFFSEEEANETGFAQALASHAELYVNDAFGTAHRAHASTAPGCRPPTAARCRQSRRRWTSAPARRQPSSSRWGCSSPCSRHAAASRCRCTEAA